MTDLSVRFGAPPEDVPQLLTAIRAKGAEPALAFNVGSSVTEPAAYAYGIDIASEVLSSLPFTVRLLDIGGGYPRNYPGFTVPPLADYFSTVAASRSEIPLSEDGELMGEPGRALAAPGLSAVVEVILRKEDRISLNDGMYGIFWELRLDEGHDRFPVRVFRDGAVYSAPDDSKERNNGHPTVEWKPFRLYGPTCDSSDSLPGKVDLPADIRQGDYLEFGFIGAYSLAGRTRFNGMYSDTLVTITDPDAIQPGDD
jgi:ornithine decarboxylase